MTTEGTFLGSLPPSAVAELVAESSRKRFESGQVLIREGGTDTHVILLLGGFVKVTTAVEGHETLLGIRLPGELVGEIGALTGEPRNATVTACGRVTAGILSQARFEGFLGHRPDAARLIAGAVARQLRWANRRRSDFAAFPAHIRLARLLSEIAEVCGRERPDGSVELTVPLSQPELAAMIAIGQATVQKAMRDLRDAGLITTGYRRIRLLDPVRLAKLASSI
ncbi:Crp/Fnr family transcriptional regulator [Actinoplanes sp. NPDC051411]|uniref:Crp/Fnr family transcriptional regulator n=1 Tax=Actinoplanes sp. NPDC051411 TaxID=3155522 RepID=UPI00341E12C0